MREFHAGSYDVAVIGAGHAGIEAGLAAARLGLTGCFRFNKTEMTVTARNNGAQILFAGLDDAAAKWRARSAGAGCGTGSDERR